MLQKRDAPLRQDDVLLLLIFPPPPSLPTISGWRPLLSFWPQNEP